MVDNPLPYRLPWNTVDNMNSQSNIMKLDVLDEQYNNIYANNQ